ncbi:MAG TPA: tetratricopeptide repeat protein [Candidatus Elarobacter sp.]|jgi:tetratricopeptide (TPR) repeat protein
MQHPQLLLSTENRQAFERVSSGLKHLEAYKESKDWSAVTKAASDLDQAVTMDPGYTAARYYAGIADDLAGRAADGADVLAPLLTQPLDEKFLNYIRYALALAEYHQYHAANLAKAAQILSELLTQAPDYILKTSTHALLAQVHAMQEVSRPSLQSAEATATHAWMPLTLAPAPLEEVVSMATKSKEAANTARDLLSGPQANALQPQLRAQLGAMLDNALGMSEMYRVDHDRTGALQRLKAALKHLEAADRASPNDWANTCDLGSVHMRFGIVTGNEHEFDEARRWLQHVVKKLRPEYGFALYEIGRTYRLQGNFADAVLWFDRALAVAQRYRDVSDKRVQREISLARESKTDYP